MRQTPELQSAQGLTRRLAVLCFGLVVWQLRARGGVAHGGPGARAQGGLLRQDHLRGVQAVRSAPRHSKVERESVLPTPEHDDELFVPLPSLPATAAIPRSTPTGARVSGQSMYVCVVCMASSSADADAGREALAAR